jgi:hypothetical protein
MRPLALVLAVLAARRPCPPCCECYERLATPQDIAALPARRELVPA